MVLPSYQPWRRRTQELACRVIWKYSPPRRQRISLRNLARLVDVQINQRDSTVIRKAVRLKSRISRQRQCRLWRNRRPSCRRYQNPSRNRCRWISAAIVTKTDRKMPKRDRNLSPHRMLRIQAKSEHLRRGQTNGVPRRSRVTYAAENSAPPAFLYTSPNVWR